MNLMESLSKLYAIDRQVRGLKSRVESARHYFKTRDEQLRQLNHRIEELETRKRHLRARIANLETEGAVLDEQLEKFRGDLNSAATNRQYTAVLSELNTVKEARSKLDDSILSEMTAVEELDAELGEVAGQRAECEKVRGLAKSQLEEREGEVGERLAELETQRAVAAGAVPSSELAVFEEMADVYDGEAMASVEEIDRRHREYACGECNMHMPFEQVSTLMNAGHALVRCTACGRILFIQEHMRGELTPK
jgi:predicted  nucleic acid-binding Zn-ribbon protein